MKEKSISKLKIHLITLLILEYRLPLNIVCSTFKYDTQYLYSVLMRFNSESIQKALRHVLDNESYYVTQEALIESKKNLRKFLFKFNNVKTREEKISLINSLNHDKEIFELRNVKNNDLTYDQKLMICKYRLKYALTRYEIERNFKITVNELKKFENTNINDKYLSERLTILGKINSYTCKRNIKKLK